MLADLNSPLQTAVDNAGNLYIADDGNHLIRKVAAGSGIITTVAGNNTAGYTGDNGPATSAQLDSPSGVAVDSAGNLYIADSGNCVIRKVTAATGVITTYAGNGSCSVSVTGPPGISASVGAPQSVALDGAGNLYIAVPIPRSFSRLLHPPVSSPRLRETAHGAIPVTAVQPSPPNSTILTASQPMARATFTSQTHITR